MLLNVSVQFNKSLAFGIVDTIQFSKQKQTEVNCCGRGPFSICLCERCLETDFQDRSPEASPR